MLLPLLLALGVVLGLGSYFETSDDGSLAWMFSGVLARQPVASVPLYMHGYGHLLAAAYTAAPAVPWLGLLLGGLLALTSALWFAVLERLLRPHVPPGCLMLLLVVFFGLAWLEHWLWFSHARVALLLAAGGLMFAAQRPGRRWPLLLGLGALLAAWLIRPSLAGLGAAAAVPVAVGLAGSWRRAVPLLLSAGLLLGLAFGVAVLGQTPSDAQVQARDGQLARILDYEQLRSFPRTAADSLGTAAISLWLLGDSGVVDPVLHSEVYRFDAADFMGRVVPAKLAQRAGLLLRDYFPVLLALLATAGAVWYTRRNRRRGFWLVQAGFALVLIGLAGILKLPPRLALPLLDCWLVTNLVFWLHPAKTSADACEEMAAVSATNSSRIASSSTGEGQEEMHVWPKFSPVLRYAGAAAGLLIISLYAAKTWHRHHVLQEERQRHEEVLTIISRNVGRVRVLAGTNDLLKSLTPFRTYSLGPGPALLLTGWPAHDTSQTRLRRALTGTADQTECLRRLARQHSPNLEPLWFLTPETVAWLNGRLGSGGAPVQLVPQAPSQRPGPMGTVREYRVRRVPKP
ncbi:hypothetical protein GCM10022409_29400 [Hymenobacter glaciei]|uniref:Glycosyltransferase RgtA/B/C/D-like domain-containing protein n=1 Tax=Hymenobacter glaciei TaxID=877209 RepID=A0ABP7UEV7_9BACT